MSKLKNIAEIFKFLVERKKFWLIPIIVILFIFSFIMVIVEGSAVSPFIYALF